MTKTKNGDSDQSPDPNARLVTSKEDKAKARKWFERARELGERRQFDYAIEYYVNGLEFWPDAVEDACKPLHGCAVARRQTGGKKPGLKDTMRRSMNDKNPKQAFLNAAWLFGHDPDSIDYMEGLVKTGSRLRAEDAATWGGRICLRALENAPKASPKQFQALAKHLEEIGDRAAARGEAAFGVETYQMGVETINIWRRRVPKDRNIELGLRDLSTKLTILKGSYQTGESFRGSMVDSESQKELHDRDQTMQSDDRLDALIASAQTDYDEDPDKTGTLKLLVGLLCRREQEDEEFRAIGLLVAQHNRTGDYSSKHLADDIRMKQLTRKVRVVAKGGDQAATKEAQVASLRFDLSVFKERLDQYPTDNRVKSEYAIRLFRAGRFDDAIPIFQTARADPKNRSTCGMYLGRCFFRKGYFAQAISALEQELEEYQFSDDELAKLMLYWLGRSQEAGDDADAARETFGKILQLDYNYKDVRARLNDLPPAKK